MTKFNSKDVTKLSLDIQNYFENFKFENDLKPLANVPLTLHWSDSKYLIDSVRRKSNIGDPVLSHERKYVSEIVESLKKVHIWIQSHGHIVPMTMYDVYFSMGQFLKKESLEDELYNSTLVSFIGPTGPFKEMALIDCINEQTLKYYIHWLVISNKLPQRGFRLSTSGNVKAELNFLAHNKMTDLAVKQITDTGILFSCHDDFLLDQIDSANKLTIYFETDNIVNIFKDSFVAQDSDLYFTKDKHKNFKIDQTKVTKKLKYNSHKSGEFYMFCRYAHMKESDVGEKLSHFTSHVKKMIQESVA